MYVYLCTSLQSQTVLPLPVAIAIEEHMLHINKSGIVITRVISPKPKLVVFLFTYLKDQRNK